MGSGSLASKKSKTEGCRLPFGKLLARPLKKKNALSARSTIGRQDGARTLANEDVCTVVDKIQLIGSFLHESGAIRTEPICSKIQQV